MGFPSLNFARRERGGAVPKCFSAEFKTMETEAISPSLLSLLDRKGRSRFNLQLEEREEEGKTRTESDSQEQAFSKKNVAISYKNLLYTVSRRSFSWVEGCYVKKIPKASTITLG